MDDELETKIRDLHSRGEISDTAFRELLDTEIDRDLDEEAEKIVEESLELGDHAPVDSVDGECSRCEDEAVWRDPVNEEIFCETHAKEHFEVRHN